MTFESAGLLIVAIYIWLPPASYVVFLTTLVSGSQSLSEGHCGCTTRFSVSESCMSACVLNSE